MRHEHKIISLGLDSDTVYNDIAQNHILYLSTIDKYMEKIRYILKIAESPETRTCCHFLLKHYKQRYKKVQRGLTYIMESKNNKEFVTGINYDRCEFRVEYGPANSQMMIINRNVNYLIDDIKVNYDHLTRDYTLTFFQIYNKIR